MHQHILRQSVYFLFPHLFWLLSQTKEIATLAQQPMQPHKAALISCLWDHVVLRSGVSNLYYCTYTQLR